jgi:hypothetical protein
MLTCTELVNVVALFELFLLICMIYTNQFCKKLIVFFCLLAVVPILLNFIQYLNCITCNNISQFAHGTQKPWICSHSYYNKMLSKSGLSYYIES